MLQFKEKKITLESWAFSLLCGLAFAVNFGCLPHVANKNYLLGYARELFQNNFSL